jgi:nucleoside-diphosphate-sugar epimerase
MTRIAIIGSEGCLGRSLRAALAGECEITRADVACPNEPGVVRADVRSGRDMAHAVDGADVVVHLAAYHGGYQPPPTDDTRFHVNVVGTFNVLQACLEAGIQRVVWASSTAALSKRGMYCITKVLGEDLCDYFHQTHGFQIAMMRYDAFTACDLVTYGQRLLHHGVDRRDCVEATVRAVRLLAGGSDLFGRYIVAHDHPWTPEEHEHFGQRWKDILGGRCPRAAKLIDRYRIEIPSSVRRYDQSSTRTDLDFAPRHDFETFLAELSARDTEGLVTPESPRWSFETGRPPDEGVAWPEQERIPGGLAAPGPSGDY